MADRISVPGEVLRYLNARKRSKQTLEVFATYKLASTVTELGCYGWEWTGEHDEDIADQCTALVCGGTKVDFIDVKTGKVQQTLSKFSEPVLGAQYREDGQLLLTSDSTGLVKVWQSSNHQVLRSYRFHRAPARRCAFTPSKINAVSVADDFTMAIWDISSETPLHTFANIHTDRVTSLAIVDDNQIITAAWDGWCKLWDNRVGTDTPVRAMHHEHPINAIQVLNNGEKLVTANGPVVSFWDWDQAGEYMEELAADDEDPALLGDRRHHLGIVADVRVHTRDGQLKLLSASADNTVKLTTLAEDLSNIEKGFLVEQSYQASQPLSACAFGPNDHWVIGSALGTVEIVRPPPPPSTDDDETDRVVKSARVEDLEEKGMAVFKRMKSKVETVELELPAVRACHSGIPKQLNRRLTAYEYHKALSDAIAMDDLDIVCMISEELISRGAMIQALRGLEESESRPLLDFLNRHLLSPLSASVLTSLLIILGTFLENNSQYLIDEGQYSCTDLLRQVRQKLLSEITRQNALTEICNIVT